MARRIPVLMTLFLGVGCAEPVREDRAADWGRDGNTVAFQHDKQGVYVADKEGSRVTRIFEPDESVLAASRPLYSPTDGRLIFTTAYPVEGGIQRHANSSDSVFDPTPPEGRVVWQEPVKYTCWQRAEAIGDDQPEPKELFSARCEHIGYIAAGLAVRWHPDGRRILYLDSTANSFNQHGVYEFDLATEATHSVFPHRADALIFDFAPAGSQLACVTAVMPTTNSHSPPSPAGNGIWIGNSDDAKSWWKVAGPGRLASGELPSVIESLRASRPAWTADGSRFASVVDGPEPLAGQPRTSLLQVTRVAARKPLTVHKSDGQLADLHWSPDGARLGFLERKAAEGDLRIYDRKSGVSEPLGSRPVRKFAGFDANGARLAYVVPDDSDLDGESEEWALLLRPNRLARDAVLVADANDPAAATQVFSGMRVTFPVWSPTENRLSLWMTFVPRYQSLLSLLRQWGLLPGDPAATLDLATGDVSWLAVTPAEELQVGHYYLLKKDYARAWEWYARANEKLPKRTPPRNFQEFTHSLGAPGQSTLFEYHCLAKLGRHEAAELRLEEFERNFFPAPAAAQGGDDAPAADPVRAFTAELVRQLDTEAPFLMRLIHDLYVAEVFLSVDDGEAGIEYFRRPPPPDFDEAGRVSRNVALAQLLLIARRPAEYLELCPEFLSLLAAQPAGSPARGVAAGPSDLNQGLSAYGSLLCLAPLFRRDFLDDLPEDALRQAAEDWDARRTESTMMSNVAIDLFLRAAHQVLGNVDEALAIEAHLLQNPAIKADLGDKSIDDAVGALFALPGSIGRAP